MKRPSCVPVATSPCPRRVAADRQILDLQVEVRERPLERGDHGTHSLGARRMVRPEVLVLREGVGRDLVGDVQVARVEALLDQPAKDTLWIRHAKLLSSVQD
jgi:hypothetical protein